MPAPYRARIVGTRHMAAAGHYLAAQAAFQVLEAGGNAIDAGCAGGMALGVLQSEFVSFGGVAPIMIRLADGGEVVTITGLGHWPKAASLEVFRRDHDGHIPDGILSTVIPAAPDAWITALERHGTMSFAEVAAAALRFARDGFPVNALLNQMITDRAEGYGRWPANAEIYLPGGQPPASASCSARRTWAAPSSTGRTRRARRRPRAAAKPASRRPAMLSTRATSPPPW